MGDPDCIGCGYRLGPSINKIQWRFRDLRHERIAYEKRGWTPTTIDKTIQRPVETAMSVDYATNDPATVYYRADGHLVVRNDITGEVIQFSNTNDPDWIDPFGVGIRPRP